ncbi:hypothetical protein RSOLAG22IIIB_09154 [Rhizoctonia solani]|uniref:Uncharacterized protein n=1 Tax=Rhizoctonia solani TaxID=456999 RepID=A0A0K6FX15_9AGAM|nr:hypothetical protein RSOLAG22IIIB_09154 [Rhizoctonia solani]
MASSTFQFPVPHAPHSTVSAMTTSTMISSPDTEPKPTPPSPPAGPPNPIGMQAPPALEAGIIAAAKVRANRPVDQTFYLSVVAGIWLGFGAIGALSAACGVPQSVRTEWPILPKFLMGAIFAFALHYIVIFGGELFTGTIMIFGVGWINRAIPI